MTWGSSLALLALLCGIGFSFLNSCYNISNLQALLLQAIVDFFSCGMESGLWNVRSLTSLAVCQI